MVALRVLNLKRLFVLCIFVFITLFLEDVKSHGFLQSPRSRNYVASVDGVWFGGDSSTPAAESCPHCLNIGGTLGLCGSMDGRDYVYPPSSDGGVLPFTPQATYVKNGMIDIEVKLTAHHKGHFEYRICPLEPNEIPTQACFDSHPLKFVQDDLYGAVKDSNYPARAYIPRYSLPTLVYSSDGLYGSIYSHKFKLPENLVSDRALLQ